MTEDMSLFQFSASLSALLSESTMTGETRKILRQSDLHHRCEFSFWQ